MRWPRSWPGLQRRVVPSSTRRPCGGAVHANNPPSSDIHLRQDSKHLRARLDDTKNIGKSSTQGRGAAIYALRRPRRLRHARQLGIALSAPADCVLSHVGGHRLMIGMGVAFTLFSQFDVSSFAAATGAANQASRPCQPCRYHAGLRSFDGALLWIVFFPPSALRVCSPSQSAMDRNRCADHFELFRPSGLLTFKSVQ